MFLTECQLVSEENRGWNEVSNATTMVPTKPRYIWEKTVNKAGKDGEQRQK